MKITDETELCDVLHEAAKTAKGKGMLSHLGQRCLWGEAAYMCGLSDAEMVDTGQFGEDEANEMGGMSEWDEGKGSEAVKLACDDSMVSDMVTVKDFRKFLEECHYKLKGLELA